MPRIAYTVSAILPDLATRNEYLAWLQSGHTGAVIAGGASSAAIILITDPQTPIRVETRYIFPSNESLNRYLRDSAPALRAEGAAKFGSRIGLERTIGTIADTAPLPA